MLSHIQGIIWDLDGTFYPFHPDFVQICNEASAKAAIALGVNLPFEDAMKIADESYNETCHSGHVFMHEYGIAPKDYHHMYHEMIAPDAAHFKNGLDLHAPLKALHLPQIILTNGSRQWARRALHLTGLSDLFPDDKLIALEDFDYTPKARSPLGYHMAVEKLDITPDHLLMVEDTARNLKPAKDIGITTAHVHYGEPRKQEKTSYIDHYFHDVREIFPLLTPKL